MTITQVLYFIEVARQGKMSRAAEALFVSQPALSLQIKRLEEELGCELFLREPQGVSLTEQGNIFFASAADVAESWGRFENTTRLLKNEIRRHVRIGIGARAMSNGIFEAVVSFFEKHPEAEVTFITDIGGNALEALRQNRIHLALDELPPPHMNPSPELFSTVTLLRERQCLLLSRDDPRASLPELDFASLQGGAFVAGPKHSMDAEVLRLTCEECGVKMGKLYRADGVEAMMVLIRSGKGVSLGPASFARRYGVAAVPMLPLTDAPLNLICLKQNSSKVLVAQMTAYLQDYIRRNWTP